MASDERPTVATKRTEAAWAKVEPYQAAPAFARFLGERWEGLSGEARQLAYDAFVHGAVAFAEGLLVIFEMEPVSPLEREVAADIRKMVEAYRGGGYVR